jgi:PAS domain S-box-containing protein
MRRVEAGFEEISPEEIRAIERRWVGAPLVDPAMFRAFLIGIGIALAAVSAMLVWNGLLHRRVRKRTEELAHLLGDVQEARRQMTTLLNNLPGVAYRCRNDRDWTMEFISDGCRGLTGYAPEDFLSDRITFNEVILPSYRDIVREGWERTLPNRGPFHSEYEIRTASGEDRWVLERGCGVYDDRGEVIALEGLILDITEKKEVEREVERSRAELAALNADLERRVAERTDALARTNGELTRSLDLLTATQSELVRSEKMAALGRLVAGVAHEINTPVGVSVTAASYLEQETAELRRSLEEGRLTRSAMEAYLVSAERSAGILLSNLNRAAELIRSFKQVAVDRSAEQERTFELGAYLKEILSGLQPLFKRTPFVVRSDSSEEVLVRTDPGALSQIVTNLVSNALLHAFDGRESGTVELDIRPEGETAVLICRDDGRGIPAEAMPRLFEPFFTTRPGTGGSGLGLHIVYNLVTETLGGMIECSSRMDEGTTFTIRFPRGLPATDPRGRTV